MTESGALEPQDVERLRVALAEGKPTPVWFTPAAVGVEAGQQAKVVAFDEPAEGDFIQVRPHGSRDVLAFSPAELTTVKPPVKPKPAPAPPPPEPPAVVQGIESAPVEQTRSRSRAKPQQPVEITVTLHATPDGEWSVDVLVGKKRTVRWVPVPAGDIARVAKSLPAEVGEAIAVSLTAARERQLRRVAELKAELEAAQRALRDLG
ncbi:DUF6319 family protein [Actinokineospora globicatena]|uniref:DUF6319 family protein n=1 Tax=Actinokineospora globicatena TaxID=103729 RepID=UPI0020A434F1|nr:DUF6319 family protein [Actinokineospora globicatena]MCP2302696.1 hypothetical protein [Actinokineospora globicatena]GLW75616.1 hypothetical protein Aglo01_00980 [Actinokineospora globicatena]GLW82456.1 hypothetical protein Aglo02_00970 [Actinokineospora globicatena]